MPTVSATYRSELEVNKLPMQAGTYTLSLQGDGRLAYGVDTEITSFDEGTELTTDTEITVSEYITFVSTRGFNKLTISTTNTEVIFGPVLSQEERTQEQIDGNSTSLENIATQNATTDAWDKIIQEDFESVDNFEFVDKDGVSKTPWTVANNAMSTLNAGSAERNTVAWYKGKKLSDGKIKIVYDNPDTVTVNYIGIAFRRKDDQNFLTALLYDGSPGSIELWECVNGTLSKLEDVEFSGLDVENADGVAKSFEVEVIGVTVKVYINNKLMFTSTDPAIEKYLYGECGIHAYDGKTTTVSKFSVDEKLYDRIPNKIEKVHCSGTSITKGVGATVPYPTVLQEKLQADFTGKPIELLNGGHSGQNTDYILGQYRTEVPSFLPTISIIEGNINDTSVSQGIPFADTIDNIRKMIKIAKQNGAIPVLFTSTHTNPVLNTSNWNKASFDLQVVNNIRYAKLAEEERIRIVYVSNAFNNDWTLLDDDIHPNDDGVEVLVNTLFLGITNRFN